MLCMAPKLNSWLFSSKSYLGSDFKPSLLEIAALFVQHLLAWRCNKMDFFIYGDRANCAIQKQVK